MVGSPIYLHDQIAAIRIDRMGWPPSAGIKPGMLVKAERESRDDKLCTLTGRNGRHRCGAEARYLSPGFDGIREARIRGRGPKLDSPIVSSRSPCPRSTSAPPPCGKFTVRVPVTPSGVVN